MARKQKSKNTWLWYGLYAIGGWYAYSWYRNRSSVTPVIPIAAP